MQRARAQSESVIPHNAETKALGESNLCQPDGMVRTTIVGELEAQGVVL
jgi:hypothetical protein